jgi:hypothetical protein
MLERRVESIETAKQRPIVRQADLARRDGGEAGMAMQALMHIRCGAPQPLAERGRARRPIR